MLEYQLIRSKRRKTLLLQVKYGQVTVRAPESVTSAFIDTFVQEKSSWLRAKVAEQRDKTQYCDFRQGATLFFLGEEVSLNLSTASQAKVFISNASTTAAEALSQGSFSGGQLNVVISERVNAKLVGPVAKAKQVKKQLEAFFKQQAEQLLIERLELISKKISLVATKITIRQYRARWGSCNNRGELSFNYLLMMTPLHVIDYVIVHELCHLKYLNHSRSFWQLVEQHSPNYQTAKNWLNSHQSQLHWKKPD